MAFAPGSLDTDSQRDQFQGLKRERKRAKEREREREWGIGEVKLPDFFLSNTK